MSIGFFSGCEHLAGSLAGKPAVKPAFWGEDKPASRLSAPRGLTRPLRFGCGYAALYYYPSVSVYVAKIVGRQSRLFVVKTSRPEGRLAGKTAGPTWLGQASSVWLRLCCFVGSLSSCGRLSIRLSIGLGWSAAPRTAAVGNELATAAQDAIPGCHPATISFFR